MTTLFQGEGYEPQKPLLETPTSSPSNIHPYENFDTWVSVLSLKKKKLLTFQAAINNIHCLPVQSVRCGLLVYYYT